MYDTNSQAYLFKQTYSSLSRNHYNSATAILSRVRKRYDLQGIKDHVAIPMGEAGGVGGLVNGYLPRGGGESGEQIEITAKDHVAVAIINRKAMKQSQTDKGAFAKFTQRPVQKAVESYDTSANIIWHGDGTGRLCKTKLTGAFVSGTAVAPVIEMDSTTFFERWFTKNHQVNFGNAGDTGTEDGVFKIKSIDVANKRVTFERESGSYDLTSGTNANDRYIYIQNMFKAAPQGIEGTVMAVGGNIYGVAYDSLNWGSLIYDANGAPVSGQMLNYIFMQQSNRVESDAMPDFCVTSTEIYTILADSWEDKKEVYLMPRDNNLQRPTFGIKGLAYQIPGGKEVVIVADKHCRKDRFYGLFSDAMYMHHLPDHGWWDEDGKVFLRVPERPWYAATYGGYYENVLHPTFCLAIKNAAIS